MKKQIEIRGYEQGKREGIQKALEIFGNLRTHHNFKVKNGNKCSCYHACSEPYRLFKELTQKLNQEIRRL